MTIRQVAEGGPKPTRKRFEVYSSDDNLVHQIWDHEEEVAVMFSSGPIETLETVAERLNENACGICGEQCEEAHSQTRIGRVCEDCSDKFLDENGEYHPEGYNG